MDEDFYIRPLLDDTSDEEEDEEIIIEGEEIEPPVEEFLDRARIFKGLETIDDVLDVLDEYQNTIFPDEVDENSIFVFNLNYIINGEHRTYHQDGLTLDGFRAALAIFNERNETYKEDEGEGLFQRFTQISIRQRNKAYGKGDEMYFTCIENEQVYFKCFTKTNNRCLAISAIKFMEPDKRTLTATNLHSHTLIQKIRRNFISSDQDIVRAIENHYKKQVIILQPFMKINYESNKDKIILTVYENHVGYVTKEYPEVSIVEPVKQREKDPERLHAIFFWDFEFEWKRIETSVYKGGKQVKEISYDAKDPNLVCMKGLIRTAKGFEEKTFVKRNVSMAMNVLINLANIGKVLVYSVNGAKIEHQQALKDIIRNYYKGSKKDYVVHNTAGSRIKTLSYGENLKFFDTVLLLPMSLSEMASNFATTTEKGHKDWETAPKTKRVWKNEEWTYELDKDQWYLDKTWNYRNKDDVDYCMNDCVIAMEAMFAYNANLRDKVDCIKYVTPDDQIWVLGNSSISSIGKQTLLKKYPKGLNDNILKSIFQETYEGGRCEIFYHGFLSTNEERKLVSIDINSSYPYQASQKLPYTIYATCDGIPRVSSDYVWGSFCWISYKKAYDIPPLGIKRGGDLYFPNFDIPALVFLWDFEYEALKQNLIIHNVSKSFVFTSTTFKPLFEGWYETKKNAPNKAVKIVAKQLLNGTTGGLGLKQLQPVKVLTKDVEKTMRSLHRQTAVSYDAFDGYKWLNYMNFIKAKTMFHTISYITALGRWQLWRKCEECRSIDPDCEILRLDTDGVTVFANKTLDDHLRTTANNELGGWDYETHEAAYVRGLKKYSLDNKVVFNGINTSLKDNLSMAAIAGELVVTDNTKFLTTRSLGWKQKIRTITMSKEYTKGIVLPGGRVTPLNYSTIKKLDIPPLVSIDETLW